MYDMQLSVRICSTLRRAVSGLGLLLALPSQALQPGDLMFTAVNADEDGWAMVAVVDLPAGTEVFFTDNDRLGTGFGTGEGYLRWTSTAIAAGEVLRFSRIDSASSALATRAEGSAGRLERLWLPGSTAPNLAQVGDTVYAYQGTSATEPQLFLAAISTEGPGLAGERLALTGLLPGQTATFLPARTEFAEYAGPRQGFASLPLKQGVLADTGNWAAQGAAVFTTANPELTPFTPVPDVSGALLGLVGAGLLWQWRRRPSSPQTQPFTAAGSRATCGAVTGTAPCRTAHAAWS